MSAMIEPCTKIQLLGLPGAGRKRLKQALEAYFEGRAGNFDKNFEILCPAFLESVSGRVSPCQNCLNWAVIDCRSFLEETNPVQQPALDYLSQLLPQCDAVVWMFAESSDLETQNQWHQWLKSFSLPWVQCFAQSFKVPHQGLEQLLQRPPKQPPSLPSLADYQSFQFRLPKVMLEHLLFVLDSSRQNLQMPLWRVKGSVMTVEYVNPVAIEGAVNRWDTYASDLPENTPEIGDLIIEGLSLDRETLLSLLQAAIAQGESNPVRIVDKNRETY